MPTTYIAAYLLFVWFTHLPPATFPSGWTSADTWALTCYLTFTTQDQNLELRDASTHTILTFIPTHLRRTMGRALI